MYFTIWIISGIIAGWLTGLVVKGRGFGLIGFLAIGALGGVIGGWIFKMFWLLSTNWIGNIFAAIIGGVILIAIVRTIRR